MTNSNLLKTLFATFPPQTGDIAAMLEAYDLAVEGHDTRDVEAAVRRFIKGEVHGHNQSFAPSASMLGGTIRQCMNDRLDSERRARDIQPKLPPPDVVKTPESRARVKAMADQLIKDLADKVLTDDAKAAQRKKMSWRNVNAQFDPKTDAEHLARLGYTVGDQDEESAA